MPYSTLQLCSGGGAYEAIPRPRVVVDIAEARDRLERQAIRVIDCRVMLIAQLEHEVTLSRDGRVLIKCRDRDAAERVFEELRRRVALPNDGEPHAPTGSSTNR